MNSAVVRAGVDDTGLKAWSLSQLLTALVERHAGHLTQTANVCELGCGVAPVAAPLLLPMAQLERPLSQDRLVLLSDVHEGVLSKLRQDTNVQASPVARVVKLDWAKPVPPELTRRFDIILASEVLYYEVALEDLVRTVRDLLEPSRGCLLISSFQRGTSLRQLRDAFAKVGLELVLFDIFRVNTELLHSPAQVEGYCFFGGAVWCGSDAGAQFARFGLQDFVVSVAAAIKEEEEDQGDEDNAEWVAPFAS